jgi:hypothetical protein
VLPHRPACISALNLCACIATLHLRAAGRSLPAVPPATGAYELDGAGNPLRIATGKAAQAVDTDAGLLRANGGFQVQTSAIVHGQLDAETNERHAGKPGG